MNIKVNFYSWATLSAYAVINGLIYSWSFWSKFDINVLQYVAINDLLPSIIFLLTLPVIALIILFIFMYYWEKINNIIMDKYFAIFKKYYSPIRPYNLSKIYRCLMSTGGVIALIILLIIGPNTLRFMLLFCMALIALHHVTLRKTNILIECGEYRSIILMILVTIPIITYAIAEYNAKNILKGVNTFLVTSDSPCTADRNMQYRFIAAISDKVFSLSIKDGSVCIFKYNYIKLEHEVISYKTMHDSDKAI
ncbi:hypothetical protein D3C75_417700 [compost metagenome]